MDNISLTGNIGFEWKFKNNIPDRWVIGYVLDVRGFKGMFSKESSYWIYWIPENTSSYQYEQISPNITTSSVVKIETENTHTLKWYSNGSLLKTKSTNSSYPLVPLIRVNNTYGMTLDYLKIKPL